MTCAGRLILADSVVRATPTHHLLVEDAPKWALERVDKGCRAFFWDVAEEIHGGKCIMSWQEVCRPKHLGVLGVLDLRKHGALRLCWAWLQRTDDSGTWKGQQLANDPHVQGAFGILVHWRLGSGDRILFWKDRWLNGSIVAEIAPLVVAKLRTQTISRHKVKDSMHMNQWVSDIRGELSTDELVQFIDLWDALLLVVLLAGQDDQAVWKWSKQGTYTSVSTYRMSSLGVLRSPMRVLSGNARSPSPAKSSCG